MILWVIRPNQQAKAIGPEAKAIKVVAKAWPRGLHHCCGTHTDEPFLQMAADLGLISVCFAYFSLLSDQISYLPIE